MLKLFEIATLNEFVASTHQVEGSKPHLKVREY